MPNYTCPKCARIFKQKSGFVDHMSKKIDCSIQTNINQAVETAVGNEIRKHLQYQPIEFSGDDHIDKPILQAFFECLHYLLWNRSGLDPEKALQHLMFFFAYRLIEVQADVLNLTKECRWSYIVSIKNENDLIETIWDGVDLFRLNEKTKPFFNPLEIKKADVVYEIVNHINRIPIKTLQETDTLGNIFEYMLGRGMSTMSDEGQYFTNRKICKLAFKLCYEIKKTLRRTDGSLCTFADFFCGTGGFPAEYVRGVNANVENVDWKTECNSIYCQDMNVRSVTTTLLNMLILTGVPFSGNNIRSSNSFADPITMGQHAPFKDVVIDYCFMNPPYGGDKTKGKDYKFAYTKKIKDDSGNTTTSFLVNSEIRSIGIEDDNKVSAGVQLSMATLSSDGGTCAIVLPQGFFFGVSNKWIELRKKIAEDYKIQYVIDIASGEFLNTDTKTSMMVFQKGVGSTQSVKFIRIDERFIVEASLEDLRKNRYSLDYKKYLPQTSTEVDGCQIVKIKDVVSFKAEKSKKDKSSYEYIDIGSVHKGTLKLENSILKNDLPGRAQYRVEVGDVLLGTVRPNLEHYLMITPQIYKDNLIVSNGFSVMRCDNTKILPRYLYSIITLPSTTAYLTERATGTTYPVVDDDIIGEMQISLPSLERQHDIIRSIDTWTNLAEREERTLKMLEEQIMFEVNEMGRGKDRAKLVDICEFQRGKPLSKKNFVNGNIPVIGGGTKAVGFHNIHNRTENSILVSQSGTAGHVSRYNKKVWASDCFSISAKDRITEDYLYYSLLLLQESIYFLKQGTAQTHVYPSTIENLEVFLPSLVEQQTLTSHFNEIRNKQLKIEEYKTKAQEGINRYIMTI